jgi:ATP-dependent DNA ligase
MIKAELLRPATEAMMLKLAQDDGWVFQEKHNGDRRLIERQGREIKDYNRDGLPGKGLASAALRAALLDHPVNCFVLDVELVKDRIFVFDILYYKDTAVVGEPYSFREPLVHAKFTGNSHRHIVPVVSARTGEEKLALMERMVAERAEGWVAKELGKAYRPADNDQRYNYKYKLWKSLEAVVIGDSTKRVDGMLRDSVRLGLYDEKGIRHDIGGATKKSAFTLKPGDVVEVKYLYGTDENKVVQPNIERIRFDKHPTNCTLDQLIVNKNWRTRRPL